MRWILMQDFYFLLPWFTLNTGVWLVTADSKESAEEVIVKWMLALRTVPVKPEEMLKEMVNVDVYRLSQEDIEARIEELKKRINLENSR
jgi:hypothetical protein